MKRRADVLLNETLPGKKVLLFHRRPKTNETYSSHHKAYLVIPSAAVDATTSVKKRVTDVHIYVHV